LVGFDTESSADPMTLVARVVRLHCSLHHCCVQDRESFLRQLEETENWLYEDGECEAKNVYTDRLAALKV